MAQLECDGEAVCLTDSSWEWLDGPIQHASIYDGEEFDSSQEQPGYSISGSTIAAKGPAEELPYPTAALIAPEAPPARRIMEIKPIELITTPSGKQVLDFGQNLVGWLRVEKQIDGKAVEQILLRHAEVMERGELGVRPLRTAKAQNVIRLGGNVKGYEPRLTFFGFRYVRMISIYAVKRTDDSPGMGRSTVSTTSASTTPPQSSGPPTSVVPAPLNARTSRSASCTRTPSGRCVAISFLSQRIARSATSV